MTNQIRFLKATCYLGVLADLLASLPLIFPDIAKSMFGLEQFSVTETYIYVSWIGASLMLGWTALLFWASLNPVERKGVFLLTLCPVLVGLLLASVLFAVSGSVQIRYVIPLWVFYAVIIPLYISAYIIATKLSVKQS